MTKTTKLSEMTISVSLLLKRLTIMWNILKVTKAPVHLLKTTMKVWTWLKDLKPLKILWMIMILVVQLNLLISK